ncbi:LysM peptidoglycan-binding domain-containing protein [Paenibacillus elgii]|uniref:LysM peptidoglycan-binding domain-containing protein n=1 Tax=Paenibacillus elgii TaxID=189691 RepID=UPI002D7CBD08|nr:LysM peptidoglycan-binding domain-containing protein [Paenibacillus elgii]
MDFILMDPAGTKLHFPVNPQEVSIRREKKFETVNILSLGEIDFPQGEKVKEITFSSFFPKEYDMSYCRYEPVPDPQFAMNQLNTWMVDKKPVQLIITDTAVNVFVLVSSHVSTFRGGEPGDVYFDLTCRTWREVKIRTATDTSPSQRTDLKPVPKTYVVKSDDSLWKIAKLNLGSGSRLAEIYELNKDLIGPDPNQIYPGQELVMP